MRYKKIILFTGLGVLAIIYGIWKFSPTIAKSLQSEDFKLVTNAKNKDVIYKRILERYKNEIDKDLNLDEFLVGENKKWVALSFWCDVETNQKKFFVNLDNYKKYCVMSVTDYLKDGYLKKYDSENDMYLDLEEFISKLNIYAKLFKENQLNWGLNLNDNWDRWINWCKKRPFNKNDYTTKNTVRYFCFDYGGKKLAELADGIKETKQ